MVEKIKTNKHGDCIYTEQDAINLLYTQPDFDITKLFFDSPDKYNDTIQELGIDLPKIQKAPARGDVLEFDKNIVFLNIEDSLSIFNKGKNRSKYRNIFR